MFSPCTPAPAGSTPTATSSASSDTVDLPGTVVGQTVEQQTCSVGNKLGTR